MTSEQVDLMLKNYKETVGRCGHLKCRIDSLKSELARQERTLVADCVHITQTITDMPRGGQTSDPTANVAVKIAEGYKTCEMLRLENQIEELEAEYNEQHELVDFVDAWLQGLNDRERMIIEEQVIGGIFWRNVAYAFRQRFGDAYTTETMRKIKRSAMQKIYRMSA